MTYGLLYRCLTILAFQGKCFFFLVWALSPPSAKMPWGYLSVKVLLYKVKRIVYNIYKSMIVYALSVNLLNGLFKF